MIACTIRASRSSPRSGARAASRRRDLALPLGVAARLADGPRPPLVVLDGAGQGDAPGEQVAQLGVDLVDQAAVERERVVAGPGHPDVGRPLLVARAVGALERAPARAGRRTPGPGCCSRRPTGRSRRDARPLARSSSADPTPLPGVLGDARRASGARPRSTHGEADAAHRRPRPPRPSPASRSQPATQPRTSSGGCSRRRHRRERGVPGSQVHLGRAGPVGVAAGRRLRSRCVARPVGQRSSRMISSAAREVVGVGRLVLDVLPRVRVLEAEPHGVQPLPLQPEPAGQHRVGAVGAGRRRTGA